MAKGKKQNLTAKELLEQSLVPDNEQPYDVPANWVWTKLGGVSTLKSGTTLPAEKELAIGKVIYLKVADLNHHENQCLITTSSRFIDEYKESHLVPSNSILFPKRGGAILTNKKRITTQEILVDLNIMAITPKQIVNLYYLFYWFLTIDLGTLNNGSNVPQINNKDIEPLCIPIPPISEQQRIVARVESMFAKLDQAKELAQNALDSFETRKAAILHKAFTGELTAKWREKHGVSMDSWEDVLLNDVCTINPKRVDVKVMDDNLDVTFIPMTSVSDVTGTITSPLVKPLGEVRKGYTSFMPNDVLFAKITPCMENGKSAIVGDLVNGIGFGSTEFHVFRCSEKLNNRFLYQLLRSQSFRDEAKAVMTGAVGQQRVPKAFLENYLIRIPSLSEQAEIVRILEKLFENEQKANDLIAVIDKIDLMKNAILARAFRGELGTNDPSEESSLDLLKEVIVAQ